MFKESERSSKRGTTNRNVAVNIVYLALCLILGLPLSSSAQSSDSEKVRAHIRKAQASAGAEWVPAADFFCGTDEHIAQLMPQVLRLQPDAPREPMKVFDNLYFVGERADATWMITTPDGIIVIDSGLADQVETTFIAGMKKVGLDPARIKYLLVAHEHADHFGGSKYLQDHYPGLRAAMSAAAWNALESNANRGAAQNPPPPKRDMVITDMQPVVLGDVRVIPVSIPGHTDGQWVSFSL